MCTVHRELLNKIENTIVNNFTFDLKLKKSYPAPILMVLVLLFDDTKRTI